MDSLTELIYFARVYQKLQSEGLIQPLLQILDTPIVIEQEAALAKADATAALLQESLNKPDISPPPSASLVAFPEARKPVRIFVEGSFDLIHSGHFNAFRQAKKLGDVLVVGVNGDDEVLKNKGPPVFSCKERAEIVRSCKWVDEVYEDAEYTPTLETLDRYNCDFNSHGDDIAYNSEGVDSAFYIKQAGRFRGFRRTQGISTTDIVGRLLLSARVQQPALRSVPVSMKGSTLAKRLRSVSGEAEELKEETEETPASLEVPPDFSPETLMKPRFLATSKRVLNFANEREPKPGDRVVYLDGSFDIFHTGHTELLRRAREAGDFLFVGVHDDPTVHSYRGVSNPILTLHERALMVMATKHADDVIIGAPFFLNAEMIKTYNISVVVPSYDSLEVENYV